MNQLLLRDFALDRTLGLGRHLLRRLLCCRSFLGWSLLDSLLGGLLGGFRANLLQCRLLLRLQPLGGSPLSNSPSSFSSAESLKQPEPFLPAEAPGTRTPPSRIFFSTLFKAPAFWLTSILYLLLKWFLMAERED